MAISKRLKNKIAKEVGKGLSGASKNCSYNANKTTIIDWIYDVEYKNNEFTKAEIKDIIEVFLDTISTTVEAGGCVTFANFGSFVKKTKEATTKKLTKKQQEMLKTKKKEIDIPEKKIVKFNFSKKFFTVKTRKPKRKK